jgi:type IV pilus assembly protein PilY1
MKQRKLVSLVCSALLAVFTPALAEDINLFNTGYSSSSAPNVLILLDNTSNWSANNQAWNKNTVMTKCGLDEKCKGYVNQIFGGATSLTQGQVEVASLKLVLNELVCQAEEPIAVNLGMMLLPPSKGTYKNNAGTQTDNSGVAGVIRRAVLPLVKGGSHCANYLSDLDTIFGTITSPTFKADSSANYGGAMFEAFKYFGGHSSPAYGTAGAPAAAVGHIGFGNKTFTTPDANAGIVDPLAYVDDTKKTFKSPDSSSSTNVCGAKNFLLVVGNTWPNGDKGSDAYDPSNLGYSYTCTGFNPSCSTSQPRLGDVWSRFLANTDVSPASGQQSIYTHTINVYQASQDESQTKLLKSMASHGRGNYYEVGGDLGGLIDSFKSFFKSIAAVNTAFSSASLPVSVNTQGTYLNQVYIGMFRPNINPRWPGNLKQYKIDRVGGTLKLVDADGLPAIDSDLGFIKDDVRSYWTPKSTTTTGYWTGMTWPDGMPNENPTQDYPDGNVVEKGAQSYMLRVAAPAANRVVMSCPTTGCGSFIELNPGSPPAPLTADDVRWAIGLNVDGELGKPVTVIRPSIHGDVLHSRPVAINFGGDDNAVDSTDKPKVVVFYGGNDGILRAVNGNREGGLDIGSKGPGHELWAFMAPEFFPHVEKVRKNSSPLIFEPPAPTEKPYGIDGPISAHKYSETGAWVYATMRRGGSALYAFNFGVSNPSTTSLKWKIGPSGEFANLGQTWSSPKVFKAAAYDSGNKPMLIMGGGYDTCEDVDVETKNHDCSSSPRGANIYVLDAEFGTHIKTFNTERSVVGDITVVSDGDGIATLAYAADLGGNVYRIKFGTPNVDDWSITKIASLGCDTTVTCDRNRKFMFAPDVVLEGDTYYVLVGSGDREKPLEAYLASNKVENHFFMIKDKPDVSNWVGDCGAAACIPALVDITAENLDPDTLNTSKGWYLPLSNGEQVVTSAITLRGVVTFSTHTPAEVNESTCSSDLGWTRVYNIAYTNAASMNGTSVRHETVSGGGLPPSPVAGLVTLDSGATVPFVIGANPNSGLEVKEGGGGTTVTINQPISRVYWHIVQ